MKKICLLVSALLIFTMAFASCSPKTEAIRIVTINGPAGVAMAGLMDQNNKETSKNKYTVETVATPDEVVNKVSGGSADLAACPTNVAAALYNKDNGNVVMLATTMQGVLYIVENGESLSTIQDLKGKDIYTTGQGANPEYVLRHILSKNGLDPDNDLNIIFKSQNEELAALLVSGEAKIALVAEPIVSTVKAKNPQLRTAFDVTRLWDDVSDGDGQLIMSCVIANKKFADKNPDMIQTFLDELKQSVENTADLDATAALCEEFGLIPSAAIAKAAIPGCNFRYKDGDDMKNQIQGYYNVLFAANPTSIGGALPKDDFYYKK